MLVLTGFSYCHPPRTLTEGMSCQAKDALLCPQPDLLLTSVLLHALGRICNHSSPSRPTFQSNSHEALGISTLGSETGVYSGIYQW